MSLLQQLTSLRDQVSALSAERDTLAALPAQIATLTGERDSLSASLSEKEGLLATITGEKEALLAERDTLAQHVATLEAEKKAASDEALEIVAGLGLKAPVAVDVQQAERPSAEQVRQKYMELQASSPGEAARFFSENRQTILNGYLS